MRDLRNTNPTPRSFYSNSAKLHQRSVPSKDTVMGTQPKREEIPPISLERRLSRDQEAEIDACYELLSSGRPVSEVLEEMRRILVVFVFLGMRDTLSASGELHIASLHAVKVILVL